MSGSDSDDWDAEDKDLKLPAPPGAPGQQPQFETKGQAHLAKANEPDASKFEGEDEEVARPAWEAHVPKPEKKKEAGKKYDEDRGRAAVDLGTPLDDPAAERERQRKLIEQADLQNTMDLFSVAESEPEKMNPRSARDFEELAKAVVAKFVAPHLKSAHLKVLAKALARGTAQCLTVAQIRDIESAIAGVRSEKLKGEKAAAATVKKAPGKKANINVGKQGGSAGLDDYQYTAGDVGDDVDDGDFM